MDEQSNALKAIRETDDELIVGNYIVLFGGRDLEGILSPKKNEDGSTGEFFTAQTQLESPYTKAGRLYVDWEHGMGQYKDGPNAPGPDDVLGYVSIGSSDYLDMAANKIGAATSCGLVVEPESGSTSIWLALSTTGTPTYATGRLGVKVGILRG